MLQTAVQKTTDPAQFVDGIQNKHYNMLLKGKQTYDDNQENLKKIIFEQTNKFKKTTENPEEETEEEKLQKNIMKKKK